MPVVREHMDTNRRHWDEIVPIHAASDFYKVAEFKAGRTALRSVERRELGEVRGRTLLHLQCHFGMDTLSWAREGAIVTGVDFSEPAVETARKLAVETGIDARFVVSNVYDLPRNLEGEFDIVFTSYGVLCWLPDVAKWARIAASYLKPGGVFYIVEFHPIQQSLENVEDDPNVSELKLRYAYFATSEPLRFEDGATYADRSAAVQNRLTYIFPHSLGEIVSSLIDAGLQIEFLHEFPFTVQAFVPFMEAMPDGTYRLTKGDGTVPLLFSIRAKRRA